MLQLTTQWAPAFVLLCSSAVDVIQFWAPQFNFTGICACRAHASTERCCINQSRGAHMFITSTCSSDGRPYKAPPPKERVKYGYRRSL